MIKAILALPLFFGWALLELRAQTLFSIMPPIDDGVNGHARLFNSVADSSGIFVLGEYPYFKNGDSSRYEIQNIMMRFDYFGNLLYKKKFQNPDSLMLSLNNYLLIKKNDSICFYYGVYYYPSDICKNHVIYEINFKEGSVVKMQLLPRVGDCSKNYSFLKPYYDGYLNKLTLIAYLNTGQQSDGDLLMIELDSNLQILRQDTFSYPDNRFVIVTIMPNTLGGYDGVGYITKVIKNYYQEFPVFIRIDSSYKIKKMVIRKDLESFFYHYQNFSPTKDPDGNWVVLISKDTLNRAIDSTDSNYIPYIMKFSSEWDTLIWSARFQNPEFRFDNIYSHFTMGRCQDNSGYIGLEEAFGVNKDSTSYIRMFKVSEKGDSLWSRYFYILGKEEKTSYCDLMPMTETPYQTFVVQGDAWIDKSNNLRPWLMHFDYHGCIVPGCQIKVSSEDLKAGKVRPIEIYPNPIPGRNIQFLSRVSSQGNAFIILYDLNGTEVFRNSIELKEQAQYQFILPEDLSTGIYILKVIGDSIDFVSKLEIIK